MTTCNEIEKEGINNLNTEDRTIEFIFLYKTDNERYLAFESHLFPEKCFSKTKAYLALKILLCLHFH